MRRRKLVSSGHGVWDRCPQETSKETISQQSDPEDITWYDY
jgi:hypothetical protein